MNPPLFKSLAPFAAFLVLASCGGGGSDNGGPVTVASVVITGPAVAPTLKTLGRSVQFSASALATGGAAIPGATITWGSSNIGVATVSGSGLVTAVSNGTTQITATSDGHASPAVTATVAQAVGNVLVTSTVATPDTLFAATRTRQFTALARDSNNNTVAGAPAITWASSAGGVATVNAVGLVTAAGDGSANIQATSGTVTGARAIRVLRLVATHTLTPPTSTISTVAGTTLVSGTAADSSGTALPMTWVSRSSAIVTVSPTAGTSTTVTAVSNGTARIVFTVPAAPTGVDSATVTVSNQPAAPSSISVQVGNNFFKSVRNNSQNAAVDTVAVGGTVTWTWLAGSAVHNVTSTGSLTFTSSADQNSGTHAFVFANAGTFTYVCTIHGAPMQGTIVAR